MKRSLLIILCLMLVGGCASTLTYNPSTKAVTAKDYTVKITADGTITAAPNRWFTTGFLSQMFGSLFGTVQTIVPAVVGK